MKKETELKNEIIEKLLKSRWLNVYTKKLNKKFGKYATKTNGIESNPSKDSLISNLWESLEIYNRNHSLTDDYDKIEKYCYQKAYTMTSDEFVSETGKFRYGKKKEWVQRQVEFDDVKANQIECWDEYPVENGYVYTDNETVNKAYAIDILEKHFTKSQAVFCKSVLTLGTKATRKNFELTKQTFNNRFNRTIRAIEKKRHLYIDEVVTEAEKEINDKLELIDRVIKYVEQENSNEVQLFKLLLNLWDNELRYLYFETFGDYEKELALMNFRNNDGRKQAYKLINAVYAERDQLNDLLRCA
ncbi:MAG TPA: hypothetical protein DIW15_00220 [Bavariicoccus seileri]|uniref:Uncharacterized protein n=1 Tax=Bavariicoccus seileri TaxID=549685 RepID=A0A3D4S2Z4_9ENTE|nr:hypothetical protein [Bavariicoccus seileri]HCS93120.1 hypothetical protein [Bavariicoccus seileri]